VSPRAGLDAVEDRKIRCLPGIEPRPSSPYPIAIPTELPGLLKTTERIRSIFYMFSSCLTLISYIEKIKGGL
jgi:hypothetical protein